MLFPSDFRNVGTVLNQNIKKNVFLLRGIFKQFSVVNQLWERDYFYFVHDEDHILLSCHYYEAKSDKAIP